MKSGTAILGLACLCGCASNPGVAPTGPGTYSVSRQAATGFPGLGGLRVKALREAADFCSKDGKSIKVLQTTNSDPPYILGNYPRVDIDFSCVAAPKE